MNITYKCQKLDQPIRTTVDQLKAGAILSYVLIALNTLIALLYTPFMLRLMGQNEFGLYSLVASMIAYLAIFDFGFGNAITRFTARFKAEGKLAEQYKMFGMFIIIYALIGFVVLLSGVWLYFNVSRLFDASMTAYDMSKIRIMLILSIGNMAFTFPMSVFGSIMNAYERFVFQRVLHIVRIILNPLVMIIALYWGYRAIGMTIVSIVFNVIILFTNAWYCFKRLKIRIEFAGIEIALVKEICIYSFWVFLIAIMDRVYYSTGQFVMGIHGGASATAVYALAMYLVGFYISFSSAISGVFLPKITAMITNNKNTKPISDLFLRVGRIQFIVMCYILIGFVLFGRQFITLWVGAEYCDAYVICLIYFIPLLVPLIQNLGLSILQAHNLMKFRSILYLIAALLSLGLSLPLAKLYGGVGCAAGSAISITLCTSIAMNIYYWYKISIDIPTFWYEIAKMSIFPIIVGLVTAYVLVNVDIVSWGHLIVAVVLFSICYLPTVYFFSMNCNERELFLLVLKSCSRWRN
jgi:O-antigen/teichoic acid export membrane protein